MFNRHGNGWSGRRIGIPAAKYSQPHPGDTPTNPPPTGVDGEDFATNAKAQPETYNNSVYLDPDLIQERDAVKNLHPRSAARFVFTGLGANDNWDVVNNWWDTTLNIAAKPSGDGETALIPQGKRCVFDVPNGQCPNLKWLRVDGVFDTDTTANRTFTFETVFIDHTGERYIGTEANPVPANRTIITEPYRCDQNIDHTQDMMLLTRGEICFDGVSQVWGASKREWARLTAGVNAGATILPAMNAAATGWQVGDEVRITGTRMGGYHHGGWEPWQSENGIIKSIGGVPSAPIIELENPLANDHLACFADASLTPHILNLTRNVIYKTPDSQNPEVWQRPHILRKGNGGIIWKHYRIEGYGRTNHNQWIANDGVNYPRGTSQWDGQPWNGPTFVNGAFGEVDVTNVTGSYNDGDTVTSSGGGTAVLRVVTNGYAYLASIDTSGGGFADGDTITFSSGGSATCGPNYLRFLPNAQMNFDGRYPDHIHRCGHEDPDNVAVLLQGGVVIDGEAWNTVHHDSHANILWNISVDHRSAGYAAEGGGSFGTWAFCIADSCKENPKQYTITSTKDGGLKRGSFGHGMWLNSRLVHLTGNVVCNNQCNILWTSRVESAQNTSPYPGATDKPELFMGLADVPGAFVNKAFARIEMFVGNEMYAGVIGFAVAKRMPNQHHFGRSFLEDATCWEVDIGAAFQYTGSYTVKNPYFIGFDQSKRNGVPPYNPAMAVNVFRQAVDFAVIGGTLRNFYSGVEYTINGGTNFQSNLGHSNSGITFDSVTIPYNVGGVGALDLTNTPWDNYSDNLIDAVEIASPGPAAPITTTFKEDECYWDGAAEFMLLGSYTDRLGTHEFVLGIPGNPGSGEVTDLQTERPSGKSTKTKGFVQLLDRTQMEAQIRLYGVYDTIGGDKMAVINLSFQDRFDGEFTDNLWHPVRLDLTSNYYAQLNPVEHGSVVGQFGGKFDTFNPA